MQAHLVKYNQGSNRYPENKRKAISMKARFYVTVDLPSSNSATGKKSKKEEKEWAEDYITDRINTSMKDLNPTNPIVRFPRAPK
jgi:hypothetical protein